MKKLFLLPFLCLLLCCKPQIDAIRNVPKEHRNAPPGTVWLKDSLYLDMTEVRNLDYLEYTLWTKKYDPGNYSKTLPDTLVWQDKCCMAEPAVEYFFRHPHYYKNPVVGVSYEQAIAFCKWRTERVLEFDTLHKKPQFPKGIEYRLPTKEEWEYATTADATEGEVYGFHSIHTNDNIPCINVMESVMLCYNPEYGPVKVMSYKPNSFGFYNMIGNVAEMISEKGVCKGGSWIHSIERCKISDSICYDGPKAWLGFRCICVVKK